MSPIALDRPILFVGGKGGVGKTTIAAALALGAADAGVRTLLVSTDPAHSLGDLFGRRIGDDEVEITAGLNATEIDPERELDRYLERVKGTMRSFVRPAMYPEIERQMELTRHSPGAEEAALMDRMAALMYEARERYDRVVFDTAPTGHTLRLLALPEIMSAWTDGLLKSRDRSEGLSEGVARLVKRKKERDAAGAADDRGSPDTASFRDRPPGDELSLLDDVADAPDDPRDRKIRDALLERRRTFTRARRVLLDPETTSFLLVLVPERLPILESAKALAVLRRHGVPIGGLVVNRVLPERELGEFLESRRVQEAEYLERIDRELPDLPTVRLPLLARDVVGLDALREIGGWLDRGGLDRGERGQSVSGRGDLDLSPEG